MEVKIDKEELALVVGLIRDIVLKDKIDQMDKLVKQMMEYDSERGSGLENGNGHSPKHEPARVQSPPPEKLNEFIPKCKKCKKPTIESADKDLTICNKCLTEVKEDFKNGSLPWDKLKVGGKRSRIRIALKREKEHIKEVYNPDIDPIKTGME